MKNADTLNKKKKFSMPDTLVLLFCLIILATILTWIIPAGTFDYVFDEGTNREIVVPGTFHQIEQSPVGLMGMLSSVQKGMIDVAYIMGLMFLVGGCFGILTRSGAIDSAIYAGIRRVGTGNKGILIIPAILIIISGMASFLGSMESMIAFVPIAIAACRALGYDTMTGLGLVLAGICAGATGTAMSVYTVVTAQAIAGLPVYSGMQMRIVAWVLFLIAACVFIGIYAIRIKKNPQKSLTYQMDQDAGQGAVKEEALHFDFGRRLAMIVFGCGILFMVFGVVKLGFGSTQIAASYLGIGIIAGICLKLNVNKMAEYFVSGAKDMLYAALIVGTSRAITIVLSEGQIINAIINSASSLVEGLAPSVCAVAMFLFQGLMNILIPSGSGQAAVTMPIMAPLADLLGVTRQTSVLAFIFGDSLTNVVSPTSGWFMAALAMAKVSYGKWMKWFWPLFGVFCIIAIIFLVAAVKMNYGPF